MLDLHRGFYIARDKLKHTDIAITRNELNEIIIKYGHYSNSELVK